MKTFYEAVTKNKQPTLCDLYAFRCEQGTVSETLEPKFVNKVRANQKKWKDMTSTVEINKLKGAENMGKKRLKIG